MSRHLTAHLTVALAAVVSLTIQASALTDATQLNAQSLNRGRPLFFTENNGQWDDRVLFKAEGAGGLTWFIERDGFTVLFSVPDTTAAPITDPRSIGMPEEMQRFDAVDRYPNKTHALKFKFQNALPRTASNFLPEKSSPAITASIESSERLSWNNNYFLGNDESKWAPDCGNYQRIVLKNVWDGVDVQWRGVGKAVEFDFVVTPGADASQIRVECVGLTGELEATADGGELLLQTPLGILRQALPEAFQIEQDGSLSAVHAEFSLAGGNSFGIALPEGHDSRKPLVVDPLVYSTYLGGGSYESAYALITDGAENFVVAGIVESNDFPTTEGAFDRSYNGDSFDAFVAKLNGDGSELIYSTYLGGGGNEIAWTLAPDGERGVFVTGQTTSVDFPNTRGAFDRSYNGGNDVFVTRLNEDGSELLFNTFLGGRSHEEAKALAPDGDGGVVVAGRTECDDFPTTEGAFDRSINGGPYDVFVSRLNADGSELIYSTYLGGGGWEDALALMPDGAGGVIVSGQTPSNNFPTTEGAFDRSFNGSRDAFITRLSEDGSDLIYSTYLGGDGPEQTLALSSDGAGGVVVTGYITGDDFPTTEGAFDRSFNGGNYDVFVARLNEDGSELIYGTYLGGEGDWDLVSDMLSDGAGGVIITGNTNSNDFPITDNAFDQSFSGSSDAFITRLSEDGSELLYSTYLGGSSGAETFAITLDGRGGVVVAGRTHSDDFPTTEGAFDQSYNGGSHDAFVTDIDIVHSPGMLFGHIYDLTDGSPLSEVQVFTSTRDSIITDEDGYWQIDRIGFRVFDLTASKVGYNDSTLTDFEIAAEESREVNFSLRHPEFEPSLQAVTEQILRYDSTEVEISLSNNGNGLLEWSAKLGIRGDAGNDPWTLRETYPVSEITGDSRISAVVFADDKYFISGANVSGQEDYINMIYVLNSQGEPIERFPQPFQDYYGMRDLTWDGELIWGCGSLRVYGFDLEGNVVHVFNGPLNPIQALTWDSERELLWITGTTSDEIVGCNRDGEAVSRLDHFDLSIYGLGYCPDDPDYYPLYVLHCPGEDRWMINKIDPDNNTSEFVTELIPDSSGVPKGMFITHELDYLSWVMMAIANDGENDRLDIWQIAPNTSWMEMEPEAGTLNPGSIQDFSLELNATNLISMEYPGELVFTHNAASGETRIPIDLTVVDPVDVKKHSDTPPTSFNITRIYPNPFNSTTRITYSLSRYGHTTLCIYNLSGREVARLVDSELETGTYSVEVNAIDLPSGLYFARLSSAGEVWITKLTLLK